ncbi:MAG: imidazole glycerol phosphate synthase subunit HisH, partial [Pirellula sp.]
MNQRPIVGIIDYQMGNLRSVSKGIERAGGTPVVSESFSDLKSASHLILPGVGAFRDAIGQIRQRDWVGFIEDWIAADKPFLGICLGLQMLLDVSFEGGEHPGLGIIQGKVIKFHFEDTTLKVPTHVRNLKRCILEVELDHFAFDDAESWMLASLEAHIQEHLQTKTDSEE